MAPNGHCLYCLDPLPQKKNGTPVVTARYRSVLFCSPLCDDRWMERLTHGAVLTPHHHHR